MTPTAGMTYLVLGILGMSLGVIGATRTLEHYSPARGQGQITRRAAAQIAGFLALLHVGLAAVGVAGNYFHPHDMWGAWQLCIMQPLLTAAYVSAVLYARRWAATPLLDKYRVSWRDGRDALLFAGGLAGMALIIH